MPSRAWVVTWNRSNYKERNFVSMPSRAWVVTKTKANIKWGQHVSMPSRAWVVTRGSLCWLCGIVVSMPSRAWVVTLVVFNRTLIWVCFNALTGLSCYSWHDSVRGKGEVSMPSRAWVVTHTWRDSCCKHGVSMPSRAWVVTWVLRLLAIAVLFQCPHGLELLQQECPIF